MKSIALIIWLIGANGTDRVVQTAHLDSMASCEAKAVVVSDQYARKGAQTRHLCHVVVEEYGMVDSNGNPITSVAAH
jgi:acyl-CoA hydrolase